MPRENKKRGRRMDGGKKRKHEDDEENAQIIESSKRRKSNDNLGAGADYIPLETSEEQAPERPFYGLLDDDEQEFFRRADETLEANDFPDADDKKAFLTNIYKEAEGKELKIANSQSCSRLLERLIQLSSAEQCKNLFHKFTGNFVPLMSHRFASHCCEALFVRAAPLITEEARAQNGQQDSLEQCFLDMLKEIESNVGFLVTDQYASHVLRLMLLVLAGEPLTSEATKALRSKRKEHITVQGTDEAHKEVARRSRAVPKSFSAALERLVASSVAGLPTDKLRALATHPNANPTLQLLLRLELSHLGKQRAKDEASIIRTLLPEEPITADSDSAVFLTGMIYDPVGSHLVETIVKAAPAKLFKNLYKAFMFDRLPSYSRNEIASHVACRILERLGHDDLLQVHEVMIPHISDLLRKNRTIVVRTLIERCTVRDVDTKVIALQVYNCWNKDDAFEVEKLLKSSAPIPKSAAHPNGDDTPIEETQVTDAVKAHFNLLAQAMLLVPGALSALILDALVTLDSNTIVAMSKDPIVSRTLQAALTTKSCSIITTRKLVQHFYGSIGDMALDKAASHVVDCIWEGTHGLAFIRERIAEEIAENEAALRESPFGRAVWKNWKMDIYKRRRDEWIRQSRIKASNDGFQSFSELDAQKPSTGEAKTPLQLARERHAREKKQREENAAKTGQIERGRAPPRRRGMTNDASAGASSASAAV